MWVTVVAAGVSSASAAREALASWAMPLTPLLLSLEPRSLPRQSRATQSHSQRWKLIWNEKQSEERLRDLLCFKVALLPSVTFVHGATMAAMSGGRHAGTAAGGGEALAVREFWPSIAESVLSVSVWAEKTTLRHSSTCLCRG